MNASAESQPVSLQFNKRSFWGLDTPKMDINNPIDADTIMARVMDNGTHEDRVVAVRYFGLDRIKQALLNAPELQSTTISFCSLWWDVEPTAFLSYRKKAAEPIQFVSF